MIKNHDRSGWFGASDTSYVVGNWKTESFKKWWLTKMGLTTNDFSNIAMKAGTHYEHAILKAIPGNVRTDHQIIIPELKLRVNYDGDKNGIIYEVKTFNENKVFKVSKAYWRQAQVEMFAMGSRELYIVAYPLGEREYRNFFLEIDKQKIQYHKIEYDAKFINDEYLPKLRILADCLQRGRFPA